MIRIDLEDLSSAAGLLGPLVLGLFASIPARRGHWLALVLAAPPLLLMLALIGAIFNNGTGYGVLFAFIYVPILFIVGTGAVIRWYRSRRYDNI